MAMDLNHLHLHVSDQAAVRDFYGAHFGFKDLVRDGHILFMRNDDGFDLALAEDENPAPFPAWFHFGFRLDNAQAVRDVHASMKRAGVNFVVGLNEEPHYVWFRAEDPAGHVVEVYWE
jgi:catechol 2,3-dioxygenase-like lactoylglutathione lyase family enzyme